MSHYEKKAELAKKYKNLIIKLKSKRESLDMTQQEVADKCGVSFTNISAIERDVQTCSAITLIGYMEAVGMTFRSLENPPAEIPTAPDDSKGIFSSFFECVSEEEQKKILQDIKTARNINSDLLELIASLPESKQKSLYDLLK